MISARRAWLRSGIALSLEGDLVPLLPGLDAPGVLRARHRQSARTEKYAQRRILRIDHLEDCRTCRKRVARLIIAANHRDRGAGTVIYRHLRRPFRRRTTPVRGETARLDDSDLDAEAGNLSRKRLAEALQPPL